MGKSWEKSWDEVRESEMEGWMGTGKMEEIGNAINRRDKEAACLF